MSGDDGQNNTMSVPTNTHQQRGCHQLECGTGMISTVQATEGMLSASRLRALWWMMRAKVYLRSCTSVGGRTQLLDGRPRIINRGSIVLGRRVTIMSSITAVELQAEDGGRIEIGDRTFLNYGVSISAHQLVRLGCDCLLGTYVSILDNNWHEILERHRRPASRPVLLEDNVWLGMRVVVLPGVTIGHDTVVGAGSVVVKSLPPRSIAVGNPATVVRTF